MGYLILLAIIGAIAYGITVKIRESVIESKRNRQIRDEFAEKKRVLLAEHAERQKILDSHEAGLVEREKALSKYEQTLRERDAAFRSGFSRGRQWLADMMAEADSSLDKAKEECLRYKKHPAVIAAEVVARVKIEKRELRAALKALEYQLKSYEEYFPFLEEYREIIADERIPLAAGQDNVEAIENADPVLQFVPRDEYTCMSETRRNQLALDRYIAQRKSNWEIGRYYERYNGYLRETEGWKVVYQGALRGYEDFGRDLICAKDAQVEIVQAKCWSRYKEIREKHLFQLFGTTLHYRISTGHLWVVPVFVTTTDLSEAAKMVAEALKIRVEYIDLPQRYPMIKCNINPSTAERIYHLPFDQQYDRVVIGAVAGECYTETIVEAEALGFRRAWRWRGTIIETV